MIPLAMMGHAATAATSLASGATVLPKGLDVLKEMIDLSKKSGHDMKGHHGKARPKGYQATILERARTAGKGTEAQLAIGKGSATLQAADDIVNQVKRSATGGAEVMAHKKSHEEEDEQKKKNMPKPEPKK